MTPVSIADLLPRRERVLDMRPVREWIAGKRCVVTGVGFIGSELARQVSAFAPASLTCVDTSETALWNIAHEIPGATCVYGDVRDGRRMRSLLRQAEIVFHAAAMKHVPICETAPEDAYATNAGGTWNVVNAAATAQVVLVSTDKAVRPSSVMGMTKKAAEGVVTASGRGTVVRFGNVIGSPGSVVPAWERQLASVGHVTVTHPECTRYFMTVGEAVELILQAGAMGCGTYVLDMGEPVVIYQMAQEFIRLSGIRGADIMITGIRPGEKIHEELSSDKLEPTVVDGVLRATG
jgi:FlaA1/EpsC-like NDP-sugar epimerase